MSDTVAGRKRGGALHWIVAVLIGAVVGAGSAGWALTRLPIGAHRTADGVWSTNLTRGDAAANAYVRGPTALRGLLALSAREAVYFNAERDADGRRLSADCAYELIGGPMPARWWSITVYDDRDYLAMNADDAHSVDATRIVADPDGRFVVRLAQDRAGAANWLSTNATGGPQVMLRLYGPESTVLEAPGTVPAPAIRRIGCDGGR